MQHKDLGVITEFKAEKLESYSIEDFAAIIGHRIPEKYIDQVFSFKLMETPVKLDGLHYMDAQHLWQWWNIKKTCPQLGFFKPNLNINPMTNMTLTQIEFDEKLKEEIIDFKKNASEEIKEKAAVFIKRQAGIFNILNLIDTFDILDDRNQKMELSMSLIDELEKFISETEAAIAKEYKEAPEEIPNVQCNVLKDYRKLLANTQEEIKRTFSPSAVENNWILLEKEPPEMRKSDYSCQQFSFSKLISLGFMNLCKLLSPVEPVENSPKLKRL